MRPRCTLVTACQGPHSNQEQTGLQPVHGWLCVATCLNCHQRETKGNARLTMLRSLLSPTSSLCWHHVPLRQACAEKNVPLLLRQPAALLGSITCSITWRTFHSDTALRLCSQTPPAAAAQDKMPVSTCQPVTPVSCCL